MTTTVTKTIKPSGGDYSSLSAWEAGEQADLVALDQIRQAECYSFTDTTAFTIDGWTTDATRYIRIYTPATERHNGKWNAAKYILDPGTYNTSIVCAESYVRFEGLQFNKQNGNSGEASIKSTYLPAASEIRIEQCIFRGTNGADSDNNGISANVASNAGNTPTFKIANNVFYDYLSAGNVGMGILCGRGNHYIYNNTVRNCGTGIANNTDGGIVVAKNNLVKCDGVASALTDFSGTFAAASNYNASSDTTAPGANSRVSQTFTFTNEAASDFHLATSDTGAKGFGADLSADASYPISVDIDGATRVAPWDIGADGLASAGQTISVVSIASQGAYGIPQLIYALAPVSIATSESVGVPQLTQVLSPTSINSKESFGTLQLTYQIAPAGIAPAEAFGTPSLNGTIIISPVSINSQALFGQPSIAYQIAPASIASSESFGTSTLSYQLAPTSIAMSESVGVPQITQALLPASINSKESFGTPQLNYQIAPVAITSAVSFGVPTLGDQSTIVIYPGSVVSAEAFGIPSVYSGRAATHNTVSLIVHTNHVRLIGHANRAAVRLRQNKVRIIRYG